MGEKSTVVKSVNTKNDDCYFYYYSSCSKGTACPFRHEPAALRNETVCMYWMSGTCAKESCIFRHMEITKKRDKIQCWWETQPGGCKKPHCSFQHQNILDHPREEDIKRTPDLILPVKTNGGTERNGSKRQVMPPQRVHTPPITPTVVTPTPIIVPLFDGESDTESTGGTPQKQHAVQQLSAQTEWELRKLRQIQAHEANLIGYCFEDDIEQQYEEGEIEEELEEEVEEEEEMIVEEIEEDVEDAAHRRLTSSGIDYFIGDLRSQLKSRHSSKEKTKHDTSESDLRERILKKRSEKVSSDSKKEFPKSRLAGRIGKLASRAFEETLGRKELKRLNKKTSENVSVSTVAERLHASPPKKKSLLERLGTKTSKESGHGSEIYNRFGQKNIDIKSRFMKDIESDNPNFTIRSLEDIKAEKERKANKRHITLSPTTKHEYREVPNRISSNSRIIENSSREKGGIVAIKTLAQIRAEKQQVQMPSAEVKTNRKRAISPISFDDDKNKKLRNEMRNSCNTIVKPPETVSKISLKSSVSVDPKKITTNTNIPIVAPTLGLRKISIKKPPIKPAELEAPNDISVKNKLTVTGKDETKSSISLEKSLPAKKQNDSKQLSPKSKKPSKVQDDKMLQKTSPAKKGRGSKQSPPKTSKPSKDKKLKSPKQLKGSTDGASKSVKVPSKLSRNESILDEEEALLLGGDLPDLDSDEEIDEDALLL